MDTPNATGIGTRPVLSPRSTWVAPAWELFVAIAVGWIFLMIAYPPSTAPIITPSVLIAVPVFLVVYSPFRERMILGPLAVAVVGGPLTALVAGMLFATSVGLVSLLFADRFAGFLISFRVGTALASQGGWIVATILFAINFFRWCLREANDKPIRVLIAILIVSGSASAARNYVAERHFGAQVALHALERNWSLIWIAALASGGIWSLMS